MLIPNFHLSYSKTEADLVNDFIKWAKTYSFIHDGKRIHPKFHKEVPIPFIRRRSDLVMKFTDRKIYNLEFKLEDIGTVVKQAIDHMKWADYSYIVVPSTCFIHPKDFRKMLQHKLGLILYVNGDFVEILKGYHSKVKNKKIRDAVKKSLPKYQV